MRRLSMVFVTGLVATALRAQTPQVNCGGKLSERDVEKLLTGGVSQTRVEQFVRTCGIGFEVTPTAAERLRRAGASSTLIDAIKALQPERQGPVGRKDTHPPAISTRMNPKDGLTYVWIEAGTFTMGCSPGDKECLENEKPAHRVTITKGFWIGQTEVTEEAYWRAIGNHPVDFKETSQPATGIGWEGADAYCKAAGMRLPTEAEWEYAARGRNQSARYGSLRGVAWYSVRGGTHAVGQKQANGYGLYDTLGNVWEWVADWYDAKYYASSPSSDPKGPSSGTSRTMRGGAWNASARETRVSYRYGIDPGNHDVPIGVRCAGDY
jgi:formylglycine-generating enzyme required for sulfatase activity